MENPMYDQSVIPTLYAKIGATTVRTEMLEAQLQNAHAKIIELLTKYEPESLPTIEGENVDIKNLSEEEQAAILSPPNMGPSKEDLIKQLEADFLSAQRDGNTDLQAELDERHNRVEKALDDEAALREYEYRIPVEDEIRPENPPADNSSE